MAKKPKEEVTEDPDLRQPSLMEQMMGACQQGSASDEEVEEEEKKDEPKRSHRKLKENDKAPKVEDSEEKGKTDADKKDK